MNLFILPVLLAVLQAASPVPQAAGSAARFATSVKGHELAWQLSEPDEVKAILGAPATDETRRDGGMEVRLWTYSDSFTVAFVREFGSKNPFVLFAARDGEREFRMAAGERLALRTAADLAKLRPFSGLQNVDLSRLDLRQEDARLRDLTFDTRTIWPPAGRLPAGFDPAALLRDGKNPGLGLRALHARGVDGRGVTIGIIDQPLLPGHAEVTGGRLNVIAELDVAGRPPQMHGPAVSSLAAGTSVGVAPGANIAYVSMAMWKSSQGNGLYVQALDRILELNRQRDPKDRVRVVSISYGAFSTAPQAEEWRAALARAEADGLLIISCDLGGTQLDYGMLKPLPGGDREKAEGYTKGNYGKGLLVPADGRTYAHSEGANDYIYGPTGGMSWAAPYLAGLAALGFQVNPNLTPARIRTYLVRSATTMPYGNVVNPAAFVQMCREDPERARI